MKLGKNKKKIDNVKTFFDGNFREIELIGEGSYGKVYKAKKEEFGVVTYSAIKQIEIPKTESEVKNLKTEGMTNAEITKYFEKSVGKWVEEINFMSTFKDSENVVNIEDYEVLPKEKNIGWIINIRMELLNNLESYIYEHNVTDKDVLKMAIDVSKALIDCEENNVVHRDIKPDNIFVNKKGIYKVGDFGIAKRIETSASNMSKKGTDNYMAPELYKNERGNRTVDIYSLGIMLYRFFNYNRLPFLPDYPEEIIPESRENALYMRISGEKMKPPMNAPREIAEIILKACNYYSKDRYQSASELKEDLEKVYKEIVKPKVLFNYNEREMSKLFTQNTKTNTHDATISVLTGNKTINGSGAAKEEMIPTVAETLTVEAKDELKKNDEIISKEDKDESKVSIEAVSKEVPVPIEEVKQVEKTIIKTEDTKQVSYDTSIADESNKIKKENIDKKINIKEKKQKKSKEKRVKDRIEKQNSEKIKSKFSVKLKNKKMKIAISFILLIIILFILFIIFYKPTKNEYVIVPNVVMMESNAGTELLTEQGFIIEYEYVEVEDEEEINSILEQSINPNEKVEKGTSIKLKVAVSKEKVEVINVVGMTKDEAISALKEIGLNVNITEQNSDDIEKDKVISQMTDAGTKLNKGTIIELLVSIGKEEQNEAKNETKNETKKEEKKTTTQTPKQKNWSDWATTLPSGVTTSKYNIETKKQYRSSELETFWSRTDPKSDLGKKMIEQNGWTYLEGKDDVRYSYGAITEAKTTDVDAYKDETKYKFLSSTFTDYYIYTRYCAKYHGDKGIFELPNTNDTCSSGYQIQETPTYSTTKYNVGDTIQVNDWLANQTLTAKIVTVKERYLVKYRLYQGIDYINYLYQRWGDWSDWQDNAITSSNTVKTEDRTLYRYKEK